MSHREELSKKYGFPLKIHARGYDAHLVDIQPLFDGEVEPIYRFPGGDSLVSECEWKSPAERGGEAKAKWEI